MNKKDEAAKRHLELRENMSDYERGFIDGMQKQMQSSVDKAVNRMSRPQEKYQYGTPLLDAMTGKAEQPTQQEPVAYHFSRRTPFGQVVWDVGHAVHPDAIEWHPLVRQSPPQRKPLNGIASIARTHPDGRVVTVSFETVDAAKEFEQYAIEAAHGTTGENT